MVKYLLAVSSLAAVIFLAVLINVDTASRAEPAAPRRVVFAPGRVEGATPDIELRPRFWDRVVEVLVKPGQTVVAGQALLRLDATDKEQQLAAAAARFALAEAEFTRLVNGARDEERSEAEAAYRALQAELTGHEQSQRRIAQLLESGSVTQQIADDATARYESARAQADAAYARLQRVLAPAREEDIHIARARIDVAEADLNLARTWLERAVLRAPTRGQILSTPVEAGELAGPESPRPAVVMVDASRLRVRAYVEELDAARIAPGMPASIRADGFADREFSGRVAWASPRMGPKRNRSNQPMERFDVSVREVLIDLDATEPLPVGMPVDAIIEIAPAL